VKIEGMDGGIENSSSAEGDERGERVIIQVTG
jgi:hypothetical protein